MPPSTSKELQIETLPTKSLFIYMLTRDIGLAPAIIDLADNSVDGAKRIKGDQNFRGLWVRVKLSPDAFSISDNCGGIDVDTARQYAFRFGRAPGAPTVKHSVGQFGIGMKRALFKLGDHFIVKSATASSRFSVDEDVPTWAAASDWHFAFSKLEEGITVPREERGTTITVSDLHDDVKESFRSERFRSELNESLKAKLSDPINRGLSISLNGVSVASDPLLLLNDPRLRPAFKELTFDKKSPPPVYVKIYCGLGPSEDPSEAGWHVFCNGRLILPGDKSERTGWGYSESGIRIPGFHGQYNHLRGFVYFDSDDAGKLPWSTTKTDVNVESPVYRSARLEMMTLMRPVVDFLNTVKKEHDLRTEGQGVGVLEKLIASSPRTDLRQVITRPIFSQPRIQSKGTTPRPAMQRIQYDRPLTQVRSVMRTLRVKTFTAVGERTFDYYYKSEVEE
jgi:hypothetical protein